MWATFEPKIATKNFQKSPNLVTLLNLNIKYDYTSWDWQNVSEIYSWQLLPRFNHKNTSA